jgi:hypothetical protein
MTAARNRERPAQRWRGLRCVYEKKGGKRRERREFLVPRRNMGESWARARKSARLELLMRGALVTMQARTEARYPVISRARERLLLNRLTTRRIELKAYFGRRLNSRDSPVKDGAEAGEQPRGHPLAGAPAAAFVGLSFDLVKGNFPICDFLLVATDTFI